LVAVLSAVRAERNHPTAQTIYERVRRHIPTISRGTVYRNLSKLAKERQIRCVRLAEGPMLYDGVVNHHDHFVCERCGSITDLEGASANREDPRLLREAGYLIERQTATYYGLCPRCGARS
jgi:Fur family peroxide stress response transcriptional regulator